MARRRTFDGLGDDVQPFTGQGLPGLVSHPTQTEIVVGTESELSTDEALELETCEAIIERGLKTFLDVGSALVRVRELRLYRVEYTTFEAYCSERWGLKRQRAYELMNAASVVRQMSEISDISPPERESHAAALAKLRDPDEQRQAWQAAVARAEELGQRLTAALVEEVVRELQAATPPPTADRQAAPPRKIDKVTAVEPAPQDPEALREENAALRQRLAEVQHVLEEYQEHITRAQNYKPTSDRGEAVSPLLRALERVYLLLRAR